MRVWLGILLAAALASFTALSGAAFAATVYVPSSLNCYLSAGVSSNPTWGNTNIVSTDGVQDHAVDASFEGIPSGGALTKAELCYYRYILAYPGHTEYFDTSLPYASGTCAGAAPSIDDASGLMGASVNPMMGWKCVDVTSKVQDAIQSAGGTATIRMWGPVSTSVADGRNLYLKGRTYYDATCPLYPNCNDGVKNAKETDVDCGGGTCPPCASGKECLKHYDCTDGLFCNSGTCQAAAPSGSICAINGVKDGSETDVDCGYSSASGGCPACPAGKACGTTMDCQSGLFCSSGICTAPATPPSADLSGYTGITNCGPVLKLDFSEADMCSDGLDNDNDGQADCADSDCDAEECQPFAVCSYSTGQCVCSPGYADCDNDMEANGCEVATSIDDDNCGGCGIACNEAAGESCQSGVCEAPCTPDCSGKECGDDGCGGSCGTCGSGETCQSGTCGAATPPPSGGSSPGFEPALFALVLAALFAGLVLPRLN